jgi:hypothetical protein
MNATDAPNRNVERMGNLLVGTPSLSVLQLRQAKTAAQSSNRSRSNAPILFRHERAQQGAECAASRIQGLIFHGLPQTNNPLAVSNNQAEAGTSFQILS